ncbi:MAG: hypothetical protein ACFBSE_25445 [Prochloraceae cyanobacterium]
MQNVINNPLLIQEKDSEVGNVKIESGSTYKHYFFVYNLGNKKAEINISIAATNKLSQELQKWCTVNPNFIELEAGESKEIAIIFEIPREVLPNNYEYEIFIEAPQQYPGNFDRCFQKILVYRPIQEDKWGDIPQFTLNPPVSSNQPYCLSIGEKLTIAIEVENRSQLVDSFELSCPDLDREWFTVKYPERDFNLPGLIVETEGLKLNPSQIGKIYLLLHPPQFTLAGNYIRTIKLTSQNREDLALLDALYLKVLPDATFNKESIEIKPSQRILPQESGQFELIITNQGNIKRDLKITAKDKRNLFAYDFDSEIIKLLPGQSEQINLTVKPRWFWFWRRPLWGEGLETNLNFEFYDTRRDESIFPTQQTVSLPQELPEVKVTWERRPLWVLIVLIALAVTGLLSGSFYLWWILFRLPPLPKIDIFQANKTIDRQTVKESIILDWQIRNPQQLDKIILVRTDENNSKQYQTYNISRECNSENLINCIPQELISFCKIETKNINCQQIPLDIKNPGNYTFEIKLFPQEIRKTFNKRESSRVADSEISNTIFIEPIPVAQISTENSSLSVKSNYKKSERESIELKWDIDRFDLLRRINIIRQQNNTDKKQVYSYLISLETGQLVNTNPEESEDKIICSNLDKNSKRCLWTIPSQSIPAGDYTFEIELYSQNNLKEPSARISTKNTVTILPLPLPQVKAFNSTNISYQEEELIFLNWAILNPSQIEYLKLEAISSDDNSSREITRYYLNEISSICSITKDRDLELLTCDRIPLGVLPIGNYTLQMIVVATQEGRETKITQQTNTISIEPMPFEIASFSINGKEIQPGSTYLYTRQKDLPTILDVSWSVRGGNNLKIQLLPLPGNRDRNGSVRYSLSPQSERETISLQVTDRLGEQKTYSVIIQAYISKSPARSPNNPISNPESDSRFLPSSLSEPTSPEPLEINPQAD